MSEEWEDLNQNLEILMPDIEGWAIIKFYNEDDDVEILSEHVEGCNTPFDGIYANWCWQATDAEYQKPNVCWQCKKRVPDSIVALVAMAEWGNT